MLTAFLTSRNAYSHNRLISRHVRVQKKMNITCCARFPFVFERRYARAVWTLLYHYTWVPFWF